MNDTDRLALICESVRYCQRVRALGMPASCYSKALREPVHFLWERRNGAKDSCVSHRSIAARGLTRATAALVYDHAIPFSYLQNAMLSLEIVEPETIRPLLEALSSAVLITDAENKLLNRLGLQRRMPSGWDGIDALARYTAANIDIEPM